MNNKRKVLALTLLVLIGTLTMPLSVMTARAASTPPPVGVDGVIGSEWTGVTPTFVPYNPSDSNSGDLVAYNVYTRADANYLYVGLQAVPQPGDMWNDAVTLGNTKGNVYLDTDLMDGSDLLLLMADDPPDYCDATDTVCNSSNVGPIGPSVYVAYNPGSPGGTNDNPPGVGAVQELAISWDVLHNDPDMIGFPKVVCSVNVRIVQAFGNNFAGPQFGTTRFGTFSNCASTTRKGDTLWINYFAGANGARPDQTVRITNPGTATAGGATLDLCANIYVFRNDQQLAECCSCKVTPNGLRTLSIDFDLTHNPLTPGAVGEGVIKLVPSLPSGGICTPALAASSYLPIPTIRAWGVHNQDVSGGLQGSAVNQVTETHFLDAMLSDAELKSLQTNCAFINSQGSGHGICSCGRGD